MLGLPGGPGVKTPHFKCRDGGSTPCWGTKIPQASGTVQKKKVTSEMLWERVNTPSLPKAADNRQNTLRDGQRGRSSAPARPRPPTSGSSRPGTGLRAVGEKRRQAIKNLQFDFLLRQPESLAAAATGPREVRLRLKCVCVCVCAVPPGPKLLKIQMTSSLGLNLPPAVHGSFLLLSCQEDGSCFVISSLDPRSNVTSHSLKTYPLLHGVTESDTTEQLN